MAQSKDNQKAKRLGGHIIYALTVPYQADWLDWLEFIKANQN